MKYCTTCNETKHNHAFHKNRREKDGLHSQCKICRKAYAGSNKEHIAKINLHWNQRNRHIIKEHNQRRMMTIEGRAKGLWHAARERAINNGLEFDINVYRIHLALLLGRCERTGIEFDLSPHDKYKFNPYSPSVDKINPFGGYTNDNIKIVCTAYNFGKQQMTHEEFLDFCRKFVEFNK